MSKEIDNLEQRRKVLRMIGQTAVLLPIAGLAACGGEEKAPASSMPAEPESKPEPKAMEKTMDEAKDSMAAEAESMKEEAASMTSGDMPLIAESDPQAKSLGYVHDATTVDASQYPRYQDGQACSNCALYTGGDAAQGGCGIFAGKAVKATGWCSAYAPAAS